MKYRHAIFIVLLIIIADQLIKVYVKTHFHAGESVNVLGTWFKLQLLENEGMAFGAKFSNAPIGKIILTLFRLISVVVGFFYINVLIKQGYGRGLIIVASLILAGALGNLIDCLFYGLIFTQSGLEAAKLVPFGQGYGKFLHGKVVDMFYFPLFSFRIAGSEYEFFQYIFNLADAAVSTGVLTLLAFHKKLIYKNTDAATGNVAIS